MNFNPNDYEMVKERLPKFWKDNPDGAVITDKTAETPEYVEFVCKLYRTHADTMPTATGWAKTFYNTNKQTKEFGTELAETSAIGRALANYIYGGSLRASREEITKIIRETAPVPNVEDVWTTVEKPVPQKMDTAAIASQLEAEVVPECKHGAMRLKEGTKNNRAYHGYICPASGSITDVCEPKWYDLSPSGKWVYKPKKG